MKTSFKLFFVLALALCLALTNAAVLRLPSGEAEQVSANQVERQAEVADINAGVQILHLPFNLLGFFHYRI